MNWKTKLTGGVLAAAMLLSAGCSGQDLTWAYRVDGKEMPIGVYIYTMIEATTPAQTELRDQNADNEDFVMPDTYKKLLKESVGEQSMSDYIVAEAQEQCRRFFAVEREFAARDLALGEAELAYAESQSAGSWESNQEFFEDNGIAQSSLRMMMENDLKYQAVFDNLYDEGGEKAVPAEELKGYFAENYALADATVFLQAAGEEGESEMPRALDFLQRLEEGEDFYDLIYEFEKEDAGPENEAAVEKPEEGSRTILFHESQLGSYSQELLDGAFAAEVGKPVIVEDMNYIYVLRRKDALEDESVFEASRSSVLAEIKEEEYQTLVEEWTKAVTMEPNQPALDKYTPARLKL